MERIHAVGQQVLKGGEEEEMERVAQKWSMLVNWNDEKRRDIDWLSENRRGIGKELEID